MPRGGRRPGAGAPKGNLNAFKHGRNSDQYKLLVAAVSKNPEAMRALRNLAEGQDDRDRRQQRDAQRLFRKLMERLEQEARERAAAAYEKHLEIVGNPDPISVIDPEYFALKHRNYETRSQINQTQAPSTDINQK